MTERKAITQESAEQLHDWLKEERLIIDDWSRGIKKWMEIDSPGYTPLMKTERGFYRFIHDASCTLRKNLDDIAALADCDLATISGKDYDRLEAIFNAQLSLTGHLSVITASFAELLSELDIKTSTPVSLAEALVSLLEESSNRACDTALMLFDPDRL